MTPGGGGAGTGVNPRTGCLLLCRHLDRPSPAEVNVTVPRPRVGWSGPLALVGAVAVSIFKIWLSGERSLSQTELALFDALTLVISVIGAIWIGQQVEQGQARQLIGPHGRSAFRRATSIFQALRRFERQIQTQRESLPTRTVDGRVDVAIVEMAFDVFAAQVGEQVMAASHAMEDWRDIVPEDVEEMERQARERQGLSSREPEIMMIGDTE